MLKGKKTYLVMAGAILTTIGAFVSGQIDVAQAVNQVLMAAGVAALRSGVHSAE